MMEWLFELMKERPIMFVRMGMALVALISPIVIYFFKHQLPRK